VDGRVKPGHDEMVLLAALDGAQLRNINVI